MRAGREDEEEKEERDDEEKEDGNDDDDDEVEASKGRWVVAAVGAIALAVASPALERPTAVAEEASKGSITR